MSPTRRDWLAGVAAAWSATGCREELGSEVLLTALVDGTVRVGRRPVGGGWVEFWPVEGTVGDLRSAPLRPDGTFPASRVAVGRVLIRLVAPPVGRTGDVPFDAFLARVQRFDSPIRRRIAPGGPSTLDIDLWGEHIRGLRAAVAAPEGPGGRSPTGTS